MGLALFAVGFVLLAWLEFRDPEPPSASRLRPLPPNVTLVSEEADCDQGRSSHRYCTRTLRFSKADTSASDLEAELDDWYRAKDPMTGAGDMTWSYLTVETGPDGTVAVVLMDEHIE